MSYQPQGPYEPHQGPPSPGVAPVPRRRRSWLGPLLIVAGLVGAAATFGAQQLNHRKRVDNLERAVSGYKTNLTFQRAGTFHFYYEYAGTFTASVDNKSEEITIDGIEQRPEFTATLTDPEGGTVDFAADSDGGSYDVNGHKGRAYRQAEIASAGDYVLEIAPGADAAEFALAIGIGAVKQPTLVLPLVIGLLGVGSGLLISLLSGRRRSRPAVPPAAPTGSNGSDPYSVQAVPPVTQWPTGGVPTAPYGMPPVASPPPPPPPAAGPTAPGSPLPPPTWGPPGS